MMAGIYAIMALAIICTPLKQRKLSITLAIVGLLLCLGIFIYHAQDLELKITL